MSAGWVRGCVAVVGLVAGGLGVYGVAGCAATPLQADNVLLITIDTLRADRVGAYGYTRAQTPALDSIAARGTLFTRAFSSAPITQTSHATILTGLYPQGHGARHNGQRIEPGVTTLADRFAAEGFTTAAFVAAFPLDKRFGLARGFQTYSDTMPNGANGRPLNQRPGRVVVDEAIQWLTANRSKRFFLWVHLFEPHAPYGDPGDPAFAGLSASDRYDREVAEADRQVARLLAALGEKRGQTLIVATSDHGEAFGEHGEIGHSMFIYDTTLRVPLLVEGPGVPAGHRPDDDDGYTENVGLVDLAPTLAARAGLARFDGDGEDLTSRYFERSDVVHHRNTVYYAETFAPLLDFGWSPLRSVRQNRVKYIEAPREELYDVRADPRELTNRISAESTDAGRLKGRLRAMQGREPGQTGNPDPDGRLAALGYVSRSGSLGKASARPDPKDKIAVAAAIARITSGEARGADLEPSLRAVLKEDPGNPQMNLRLGHVLASTGRCAEARAHFDHAIRARMPTADAHLGLAACMAAARQFDAALTALREADRLEPGNPVVAANIGLVTADAGRPAEAIPHLQRALAAEPGLHQARFGLAVAYARVNRREEAMNTALDLLRRLPLNAPQRPEVERLIRALR